MLYAFSLKVGPDIQVWFALLDRNMLSFIFKDLYNNQNEVVDSSFNPIENELLFVEMK